MKHSKWLVFFALLASFSGCSKAVPQEKLGYVGEWQGKTMYLLITQDGSVKYKRLKEGGTTSGDAPLQGFSGDNFDVGVGPVKTTFVVSKPPYQDGGMQKMVVDGIELTKID